LRDFLGVGLDEVPPDHSTISRTRRLITLETHRAVFIARQADWDVVYSRRAIELLKEGISAPDVLERVLRELPSETLQMAIVDGKGHVAASTGGKHSIGKGTKSAPVTPCKGTCWSGRRCLMRWPAHSRMPQDRWLSGC
jgi:Family of unknown function (DUF1028)